MQIKLTLVPWTLVTSIKLTYDAAFLLFIHDSLNMIINISYTLINILYNQNKGFVKCLLMINAHNKIIISYKYFNKNRHETYHFQKNQKNRFK